MAPDAVKDLSELAQAFADDYPTQKLILKWIDGEPSFAGTFLTSRGKNDYICDESMIS